MGSASQTRNGDDDGRARVLRETARRRERRRERVRDDAPGGDADHGNDDAGADADDDDERTPNERRGVVNVEVRPFGAVGVPRGV